MITDNDKFFQKHHITRTLFIIIQIIGKTKSWKNTPFFRTLEQMRHIKLERLYLPRKKLEYKLSGISSLSAYAK